MSYRIRKLPVDDRVRGAPELILTSDVLETLTKHLPKRVILQYHENVAYIAGHILGDCRVGMTVIFPEAITTPNSYDTTVESHAATMDALGDLKMAIVAQVHVHPGTAVYHSDDDDERAFVNARGFWSLVFPNYGRLGLGPVSGWGCHLHDGDRFHLLTAEAASARVRVARRMVDLRDCIK